MARNNRTAGHAWERKCVKLMKECGFDKVVTSRSESRATDNKKIDIMNEDPWTNGKLPISIQAKNYSKRIKYDELLKEIDTTEIPVIFHKYTQKATTKFVTKGKYAILNLEDFLTLIKKLKENNLI